MKQCSQCTTMVAADEAACTSCGNIFFSSSSQATVVASADPRTRAQRREISVAALFASRGRIVIGRAPDCGICLTHPMVSARHAILERVADGLRIMPYDSARSVIVGGMRIREPALIRDRRRFGIGPFLFTLTDDVLQYLDSSTGLRLEARDLEKAIELPGGHRRKLLSGVNLVVEPGEFVSLLGPSGSGKSTLMDCLNGRRRATSGHVVANGEDFYAQYHTFRHSLGYVPQKDIVHAQLTVERALRYTARLRLPKDIHRADLDARVEEVIAQMELAPHRRTLIGNLSGGQIKRVSLGAELLARPSLLYIDEATSGLDAGTEARMMVLFRQLADDGKSVVCITHNVDNVDRCHLILVLAAGRLIYCGPPHDAPPYFGVKRLGQIYDQINAQNVDAWAQKFQQTSLHEEFIQRRLAEPQPAKETPEHALVQVESTSAPTDAASSTDSQLEKTVMFRPTVGPPPKPHAPESPHPSRTDKIRRHLVNTKSNWHQFRVLTARYIELIWRDPRTFKLLLLQAPIVGLILAIGLVHLTYSRTMPWNVNLDESQRDMLKYLHQFNIVLAAAEHNTVEPQKELLKKIEFTISNKAGVQSTRTGYELAVQIQQLNKLRLIPAEPIEIVLGSAAPGELSDSPKVSLKELVGMAHAMAKIDKGHQDKAQEILNMDTKTMPIVPHAQFLLPNACWSVMFILSITVFWFGCNNAAKEIVREEAIYARERAAGIAILPYLGSKFVVLAVMSVLQALTLLVIVHGALRLKGVEFPHEEGSTACMYFLSYRAQFGILALLSVVGVACGLLLSACVATPDRATALTPYILIPQIILGGSFIPVEGLTMTTLASLVSPCYWAYRALHHGTSKLPTYFAPHYHSPDYSVGATYVALTVQLLVMLTVAAVLLRRKDLGKG